MLKAKTGGPSARELERWEILYKATSKKFFECCIRVPLSSIEAFIGTPPQGKAVLS